jgi:acyl-homoserine-lactone acylase
MFRFRIVAAAAALAALLASSAAEAAPSGYKVTVRRTAHGIPHITARDFPSLAYGYAQAFAEDNICVIADSYVTVRGERSKYFGPGGSYSFRGNGTAPNNLNSDFFYRKIITQGTVEKLIAEPPPAGPVPEIKAAVKGYVEGYNDWLAATGVGNIPDPACRGKDWVRPIEEIDAYRRFYQLALLASAGVAIDGIGNAAPAGTSPDEDAAARRRSETLLGSMDPGRFDELLGGIGSNAVALGKAATTTGNGLLLGNPHFPWDGAERFYQAHLTIPGEIDVQGGSLYGVPLVLIGNTRNLAWSHTVSTARRFTPYELKLLPGSQTTYLVDGQPETMTPTKVTVDVKQGDGSVKPQSRTLYDTRWGPILTGILGLPVFPWTATSAYALGDANAANFRYLNHFFFTDQAQSVTELDQIEKRYLGIPWVNTIAADSTGKAYYADIGSIPNVSNEKISACSVPLGVATDQALRVQVLDGSRGGCAWDSDPDAIKPGIFGPSHLPSLLRDDYVTNSNDSYWLSNPQQPLEGFSRVIGDERTTRALRTRLGLKIVQEQIARGGFSLRDLQDAVFNNRQYAGELWRDELVAMCKESGPAEACPVLEKWDLRDDLGSRGALLFRRFASRALTNPASSALPQPVSPFDTPFDPADPVNTPRGLNTDSPQVRQALQDAVADLKNAGIPLDAPLGDWQYEKRGEEKVPIHGGPGTVGVFNAINVTWNPENGYGNVPHGSSYVQAVELTGKCPDVRTILTYSQSSSPESPWFADQTRMYSKKEWVDMPFCPDEVNQARLVGRLDVGGGALRGRRLLSDVRVKRLRARRVRVSFRLARRATVRVSAGRRHAARRLPAGRRRLVLRHVPRKRFALRLSARAGSTRYAVVRRVRKARTARR